jgi:hypothetical protein
MNEDDSLEDFDPRVLTRDEILSFFAHRLAS